MPTITLGIGVWVKVEEVCGSNAPPSQIVKKPLGFYIVQHEINSTLSKN